MGEVITIGLDIAKSVFQVHGVDDAGTVLIRKRVSRAKVLEFFAELPPCLVGIEACPSAHHWGRELHALGHTVRLLPPSYVRLTSNAARTMRMMRQRSARRSRGHRCGSSRSRRRSSRLP